MKRSLLALAVLSAAIAFCVQPARDMAEAIYRTYKKAKDWLVDHVATAFKLAGAKLDLNPVSIRLVQAKAFVARLAKRERPVVTSSWRMCPSC